MRRHHPDRSRTVVLLCRGCCRGARDKHPKVDHDSQERVLPKPRTQPGVELRVVDCLDECDRSNVAVLGRPGAPVRERDPWLGGVLTERATTAFAGWIAEGGSARCRTLSQACGFRHVPPRRRARG